MSSQGSIDQSTVSLLGNSPSSQSDNSTENKQELNSDSDSLRSGVTSTFKSESQNKSTKKKNEVVRDQFISEWKEQHSKWFSMCIWCKLVVQRQQSINATRLCDHITKVCGKAPTHIKAKCHHSSQSAKRRRIDISQIVLGTSGTISNEPSGHNIARTAMSRASDLLTNKRQGTGIPRNFITSHFNSMNQEKFDAFFAREVEVRLACFASINYFLDGLVKSNYVHTHGRAILRYYPLTQETLFKRYVHPIDEKIMKKIKADVESTPGCASLEVDGVTCLRRSHQLYTISKGDYSLFFKTQQLGDHVHETSAEGNDIVETIEHCEREYNSLITNLAVDNAASTAALVGLTRFKQKYPKHPPITITRDPGHCLDLLAKDCVNLPLFRNLISEVEKVTSLLTNDKIRGMMDRLYSSGQIPQALGKLKMYEPTRIGKIALYFSSLLKLENFVKTVGKLNAYEEIYVGRNKTTKTLWDEALKPVTNPIWWSRIKIAYEWFNAINICQNVTSANNFPQSAYLPLVVALKNEFDAICGGLTGEMTEVGFDKEMQKEFFNSMKKRFNMDGKKPEGRCVGLLSEHQVWAFICDPFRRQLPYHVLVRPDRGKQLASMFDFFSNGDDTTKTDLRRGYNDFCSGMGLWKAFVDDSPKLPTLFPSDTLMTAMDEQSNLRIKSVVEWVDRTGGVTGRLSWFTVAPNDQFRNKVAYPLMSARTSGSMSVERVAKPLKNDIFTTNRNRLGFYKASVLLRVGINLRYCYNSNMKVRSVDENVPSALEEMYLDYQAAKSDDDVIGGMEKKEG
jgi:hypothetical protein